MLTDTALHAVPCPHVPAVRLTSPRVAAESRWRMRAFLWQYCKACVSCANLRLTPRCFRHWWPARVCIGEAKLPLHHKLFGDVLAALLLEIYEVRQVSAFAIFLNDDQVLFHAEARVIILLSQMRNNCASFCRLTQLPRYFT